MAKRLSALFFHSTGYYAYRLDGKMKYIKPKGCSEQQAQEEYKRVQLQIGEDGRGGIIDRLDTPISEFIPHYLEDVQPNITQKNYREKADCLNKFCKACGMLSFRRILPIDIDRFVRSRVSKSTGGGRYSYYSHVHACLDWVRRKYKIAEDPMADCNRPAREARGEEVVLSSEEWGKILPQISDTYRPIAEFCWLTGCRPREAFTLTVAEVYYDQRVAQKIQHKNDKHGHTRNIPLTDRATEIVKQAVGGRTEGLVFLRPEGRKLCSTWLNDQIAEIGFGMGRKAGTTILYSLRHSAAVRWLGQKISIHEVAAYLGNTVEVCERHYAHTIARMATSGHRLTD